jgi:hypothetical protein
MLPMLLVVCALGQPVAPAPGSTPPPVVPAATPAQPEAKADPAPLGVAAMKGITDRQLARGVGAYYSARQLMDWVAEANPSDAEAVKQLRDQWEAEAKPGYDALIHEMGARMKLADDGVIKTFKSQLDKSMSDVKAKLDAPKFHAMVVEHRLELRSQPPQAVSFLYMFDPARAGDDMKLFAAGKVRTVRARVAAGGGVDGLLEFTVPLSWNTVTDQPGSFVVGENAGVGPLSIAVNGIALPRESVRDPVMMAAFMASKGTPPRSEPERTTLAGRPAGQALMSTVVPSAKDRICALQRYIVAINGDTAVAVAVGIGASVKPNERDYTRAELAAYAESRKAVIEMIQSTMKFVDTPVVERAPAPAPTSAPTPTPAPVPAPAPAK